MMIDTLNTTLQKLGFSSNVKGYTYALYGINTIAAQTGRTRIHSGQLYCRIAERFDTTPAAVEKCLRTAIKNAWVNADERLSEEIFHYSIRPDRTHPTNTQFVYTVAEYVKLKCM